jgi:hypothetical protein
MRGSRRLCAILGAFAIGGASVGGCGGESTRRIADDAAGTGGTGNQSMGGTGNVSRGGTGAGGTAGCDNVVCNGGGNCPDGIVIQDGCLCPQCSCEGVACVAADCPDGARPILKPFHCCPVCPEPDIDACETSDECTLATWQLECCGCPIAVSMRHVALDRCIIAAGDSPNPDPACSPGCNEPVCGPCPGMAAGAACIRGKCEPTYIGG